MNNLIRGKGGLIMGKMHTKAERAEKVKEIKAENSKKVKDMKRYYTREDKIHRWQVSIGKHEQLL